MRIKLGTTYPFPDNPGTWIRLSFKDNSIVQGTVLLFVDERVVLLHDGKETNIDVLVQGDEKSREDGILVTYSRVEGIGIPRPASQTGPDAPSSPPTAS